MNMEELLHEDEIPVGRAKDLRGQVFGKWTVLYRTHNKNGQVYWRVRCECGTERSVYGQTLLRGESRSCGCNTSTFISKSLKEDLVGQVFGKLTVIEEDFSRKRTAFKCQCECGNITIVQAGNLKSGHTQSCRCLSVEKTRERNSAKLIGQKFGKLTVIEEAYRKDYSVFWKCQCECGNIIFTNSGHLISGHTQSCGCILSKGEENISKISNLLGVSVEKIENELSASYVKDDTFVPIKKIPKTSELKEKLYIPFAMDGVGNFYCVEYISKKLNHIVFWDMEIDMISNVCDSFGDLLEAMNIKVKN